VPPPGRVRSVDTRSQVIEDEDAGVAATSGRGFIAGDNDVSASRRLTFMERVRGRTSGVVPIADNPTTVNRVAPPAVVVEDREVVDSDSDRRGRAAAIIGGMVLGGLLLWAGTKIGPDHAEEVKNYFKGQTDLWQQKLNTANTHINDLRGQLRSHDAADTRKFDLLMRRHSHDIRVDQKILHLVKGLKHQEAMEAARGVGAKGAAHIEHLRHYGDTIWDHAKRLVERRTGRTHNWAQVHKVTAKILQMNGLHWNHGGWGVNAHKLPVGYDFKVPNKIT
jgi:hypothetical protein